MSEQDADLLVLVKIVEDLSTVVAAMDRPQMNISKRKRSRMRLKIDLGLGQLKSAIELRMYLTNEPDENVRSALPLRE